MIDSSTATELLAGKGSARAAAAGSARPRVDIAILTIRDDEFRAICGISDIVGLQRADAWTKYACASAAAFTRAFLRTRPVPVAASPVAADPP